MSRSLLVRLRKRYGKPNTDGLSRREILKASLAAGAGLLLSRNRIFAGDPVKKRIAIVGAGFGGLAAAHELNAAGYDVTVVEARRRVGGRVLSFADLVPGKNVEGGAELIGSNHPTWVAYADKFGLSFLDVGEDEEADAPIVIGGKRLNAEESGALWESFEAALHAMNEDAKGIDADEPWKSPNAEALDKRTTASWIDAQEASPLDKAAMHALMSSDNAVSTGWQSYLGNLAQIKGGGIETYWTDSEVYRCKGGNDQLAKSLLGTLPAAKVKLGMPATAVRLGEKSVTVTLADGTTLEADDVIVAVPPSVWNRIAFDPPLPRALAPQMGIAVKFLAAVKKRFWEESKLSQYMLTDGPVSQTWDGTDAQPGDEGACLTGFSGGPGAQDCRGWPDAERTENYLAELERVYKDIRKNFVKARFMNWPSDAWTGASYSFPAPGEVTTVGPLLRGGLGGRIHFAGEHCCYAFVGYMEGALNSGASLAKRLAKRDGVLK
ncbi:MAG: flavin monoamine oxidase family protein [Planctomycetota bacterium]